jgi:hypothetical protein
MLRAKAVAAAHQLLAMTAPRRIELHEDERVTLDEAMNAVECENRHL